MAMMMEPEVQFAQKLASNEKPIRTKAIKKLRKYINSRSQKPIGGFTGDDLMKLWKGLFYCLWMQDKPLLQEELSRQISTLIHSFLDLDGQFLYLESFLLTLKREWNGIDRLRMDKFFQLVRFMFRQTFEMLKRKNWETSVVGQFLDLLMAQLLKSGSAAPSGLQFHILDLYMTELAALGSAELTASQNLMFIQPFCKAAAKTKDRTLFKAICDNIFSTIIDQAPFAIEELMKEVDAAEDSNSEEDPEEEMKKRRTKPLGKKRKENLNGTKSNGEDDFDSDDSDSELQCNEDIGPVLQFDYAALADKLLESAGRSSTPSQNRQRLYKIIRVLRDLNEGIFPQDEYPEEVSTDEDDEMFGSRKRMKTVSRTMEEEGLPATKKSKDLKNEDGDQGNKDGENKKNKKKKKKKKKKKGLGENIPVEEKAESSKQEQTVDQAQSTQHSPEEGLEKGVEANSLVRGTEMVPPQGQADTLFLSEVKKQPTVTVTEEACQANPCTIDKDQSETISKKKKKKDTSEPKQPDAVRGEEPQMSTLTEPEMSPEAEAPPSKKKMKKKGLKIDSQILQCHVIKESADAEITSVSSEALKEGTSVTTQENSAPISDKKKRKRVKAGGRHEGSEGAAQNPVEILENVVASACDLDSAEDGTVAGLNKPADAVTPVKKRSKKKSISAEAKVAVDEKDAHTEITSESSQCTPSVSVKKKNMKMGKKKREQTVVASPILDDNTAAMPMDKGKKGKKEDKAALIEKQAAVESPIMSTPAMKKNRTAIKTIEISAETLPQTVGCKGAVRKVTNKRKIPVTFEYEANELEASVHADALLNGCAHKQTTAKKKKRGNAVEEPSTTAITKKSQKKVKSALRPTPDFITFQSNVVAPNPLFCKMKVSPCTPQSSKKKNLTPKSESKKVTFGLRNNKTAEFRKNDRSLLVSANGSSRVPFDPKQKPKFGVLKSPPTPVSTSKTTPITNRKTISKTPKSTPKRRPLAADFF